MNRKNTILIIVSVLTMLLAFPLSAGTVEMNIQEYIAMVLASSDTLENAIEAAETADEAYQQALIGQSSDFDISLAECERAYQNAQIDAVRKSEQLAAVSQVFSYEETLLNAESAAVSFEISEEEYRRTLERHAGNLESASSLEQAEIAYINSRISYRTALRNVLETEREMFRDLLPEWDEETEVAITGSDEFLSGIVGNGDVMPEIPALEEILSADSQAVSLQTEIALKQNKLTQLAASRFSSPSELEELEDEVQTLQSSLQERVWTLHDTLSGFEETFLTAGLSLQVADLQIQSARRQLETTELQFQQGTVYDTDVRDARQQYEESLENRVAVLKDLALEIIELGNLL